MKGDSFSWMVLVEVDLLEVRVDLDLSVRAGSFSSHGLLLLVDDHLTLIVFLLTICKFLKMAEIIESRGFGVLGLWGFGVRHSVKPKHL